MHPSQSGCGFFWLGLALGSRIVLAMPIFSRLTTDLGGASHDDWLTPRRFATLLALLVLASYPQVWFGFQTFVYRDFGVFSLQG